ATWTLCRRAHSARAAASAPSGSPWSASKRAGSRSTFTPLAVARSCIAATTPSRRAPRGGGGAVHPRPDRLLPVGGGGVSRRPVQVGERADELGRRVARDDLREAGDREFVVAARPPHPPEPGKVR